MNSVVTTKGVLGLGKVSTLYYLHEIQRRYQIMNDEFSTCELILYQIDFQEINPYLPNDFEVLIPKIDQYVQRISDFQISKLLVPNITLHETLDQVKLPFEIDHPVDLALNYLKENSIAEIYLFGTSYTMNAEYLMEKLRKNNVDFLKPTDADQKFIDKFRKDVYSEKQTTENIASFRNLMEAYSEKSPVLVACTELSIFSLNDNPRCIDMADLQINAFLQ